MQTASAVKTTNKLFKTQSWALIGLGTGALFWLSFKPNRIKTKMKLKDMKRKVRPHAIEATQLPINKAGHPDPMDVDDNKMVDEGAMYSVNYYNDKKQ
ncbi:hypothetical protein [Fictibacillus barbaricus]|uniref:YbyB n=1 Tax=Fictibacillus barbaricus TaxID=182136 RepID=A0ABU1TVU6_9BACL|nr:hypothetical protein [Fictibacillus barbaricus]MDR7071312.1 hypothetical protein [Fictibacillus barbaricus]